MPLPTIEQLIAGLILLLIQVAAIAFIYAFIRMIIKEWRQDTSPHQLKTLAQMRRAFLAGSKTDMADRRFGSAVFAMRVLVEQGADPAQREEIAVLMRDGIAGMMHKADNHTANNVYRMLETLAAAAPAWEADFLDKVARSSVEGWSRGVAMHRLADLRGVASLDLLLALADDPPVANEAAGAIAGIGAAAATPGVVARLKRMLGETQNGWAPFAAARALVALGQATDPELAAHMDNFDVWTRFTVRVKAAGIDAEALTARLFAAGIVGEDRRASMEPEMIADMQKALDAGDGFDAVIDFLDQVQSVYVFDTEWNPEPEYDVLLEELSEVSSPRLPIILTPEDVPEVEGGEIHCRVAGHPARFTPKFMGDWTDLEAVLGGLNKALADAGRPERFANLHSGGQQACVIVGTAEGLADLVETIGLPLDGDANTAIAIGMAAENHMAAQIQAENPGMTITRGWTGPAT